MDFLVWGLNLLMLFLWSRCCMRSATSGRDYTSRRTSKVRWIFTVFTIVFFIFFRACIFFYVGTTSGWLGNLKLGVLVVPFSSFEFSSMILFSVSSFLKWLILLYSWILFFSVFSAGAGEGQRNWVSNLQMALLGNTEGMRFSALKIVFPGLGMPILWCVFCLIANWMGVVNWGGGLQVFREGIMLTLSLYYSYAYFLVVLSIIYFLITYFYLRGSALQNYMRDVLRKIFMPLYWLPLTTSDSGGRIKIDFVPVVGLAVSFLIVERGDELLMFLCSRFL